MRHQLNEAKKARGFFKTDSSSSSDRGKGKAFGKEVLKGSSEGKRKHKGQAPRSRSSIDQLRLRTRCARCKAVGHWARECPEGRSPDRCSPPVLTAITTVGSTFFVNGNPKRSQLQLVVGMPMASVFIGIALDAREALLDTGAQEAIAGDEHPARILEKSDAEGLPYEWHDENDVGEAPRGTGGSAILVGRISALSGLAGTSGVLRFKVWQTGAPPLILCGPD